MLSSHCQHAFKQYNSFKNTEILSHVVIGDTSPAKQRILRYSVKPSSFVIYLTCDCHVHGSDSSFDPVVRLSQMRVPVCILWPASPFILAGTSSSYSHLWELDLSEYSWFNKMLIQCSSILKCYNGWLWLLYEDFQSPQSEVGWHKTFQVRSGIIKPHTNTTCIKPPMFTKSCELWYNYNIYIYISLWLVKMHLVGTSVWKFLM